MSCSPACIRTAYTLLSLLLICAALPSQDPEEDSWDAYEDNFVANAPDFERLFAARHPDFNWPKEGARPYRLEVALYRETQPRPSGLQGLDWSLAKARMEKLSQSPPKGLFHHQRQRISRGQTCTFGDLKTKNFFFDTNVEIGGGISGNSPVIRPLQEGLSLSLLLQPGEPGLPDHVAVDLAWQEFPDQVQRMIVGLDLLPTLEEFRSDIFHARGSLALGKQRAWIYRPGGTKLPNLAVLILMEALPSNRTNSSPKTLVPDRRPAWLIRIGKEHWTQEGAWSPIAAPLAIPVMEGLVAKIHEGAAQSYMSDMNVEVGLDQVIADPEISVFLSGLHAEFTIHSLGDNLWVQLKLRDRTLDGMRSVPLRATLHGILKAPTFRSRILIRDFLLEPGERFPLGSGASKVVDGKAQRTRLWLQVDPLTAPR